MLMAAQGPERAPLRPADDLLRGAAGREQAATRHHGHPGRLLGHRPAARRAPRPEAPVAHPPHRRVDGQRGRTVDRELLGPLPRLREDQLARGAARQPRRETPGGRVGRSGSGRRQRVPGDAIVDGVMGILGPRAPTGQAYSQSLTLGISLLRSFEAMIPVAVPSFRGISP